jgi:hypothetical protein
MIYFTKFIPSFHIDGATFCRSVNEYVEHINDNDYVNLDLFIFLENFGQGEKYNGTFKVKGPAVHKIKEETIGMPFVEKIYTLCLNEKQTEDLRAIVENLKILRDKVNKLNDND